MTASISDALLDWYDRNARDLPWRNPPGAALPADPDWPYRVWLSEVMLQQTTVAAVKPYFAKFTSLWPSVDALAAAREDDVMAAWAGLGYYSRARNLVKCARAVAGRGGFPSTEAELRGLPGLGDYTAAAVAAIAFDRPANVVDGNVERVVARLFAVETPLPAAKPELKRLAATLVADECPGDWAQALMDLGSTVCRPRSPLCLMCPVSSFCTARETGQPDRYPIKTKKAAKPHRQGIAWVLRDAEGRIALVRRPDKGLLGGMVGLPTGEWSEGSPDQTPPVEADWADAGAVEHVFTHFSLTLWVRVAEGAGDFLWTPEADALAALPTVFRKALIASSRS